MFRKKFEMFNLQMCSVFVFACIGLPGGCKSFYDKFTEHFLAVYSADLN